MLYFLDTLNSPTIDFDGVYTTEGTVPNPGDSFTTEGNPGDSITTGSTGTNLGDSITTEDTVPNPGFIAGVVAAATALLALAAVIVTISLIVARKMAPVLTSEEEGHRHGTQYQAYNTCQDGDRDILWPTQNMTTETDTRENTQNEEIYSTVTPDGQRQAQEIQLMRNYADNNRDSIQLTQNEAYSTTTQQGIQLSQDRANGPVHMENNCSYGIRISTDNHYTPVEGQLDTTVEHKQLTAEYHEYDYIFP